MALKHEWNSHKIKLVYHLHQNMSTGSKIYT